MLEYNNTIIIGYNTLFSSRLVHVKFSNECDEGFLSMNVKSEPVRASTNSRPQVKNAQPRKQKNLLKLQRNALLTILKTYNLWYETEQCNRSAPVTQLIEHRAVTQEVVGSTPASPSLMVLK